jgi:hypothetical protein
MRLKYSVRSRPLHIARYSPVVRLELLRKTVARPQSGESASQAETPAGHLPNAMAALMLESTLSVISYSRAPHSHPSLKSSAF